MKNTFKRIICAVIATVTVLLGTVVPTFASVQPVKYDLNGDGTVSIRDVTELLIYLSSETHDVDEDVDSEVDYSFTAVGKNNYYRNYNGIIKSSWSMVDNSYRLYFKVNADYESFSIYDIKNVDISVDGNDRFRCTNHGFDYDGCHGCWVAFPMSKLPEIGLHSIEIYANCWFFGEDGYSNIVIKFDAAMGDIWDDSIGTASILESYETSIPLYGECYCVDVMFDDYVEDINDLCFYDVEYYDDLREESRVRYISPIYCESVSNREAIFYFDKYYKSYLINRNEMYIGSDDGVFLYELLKHEW